MAFSEFCVNQELMPVYVSMSGYGLTLKVIFEHIIWELFKVIISMQLHKIILKSNI